MSESAFSSFDNVLHQSGTGASLEYLKEHFLQQQDYHKLFEILKMQVRQTLDLPVVYDPEKEKELSEEINRKLEDGMMVACREVGQHLFRAGRPEEGWMYLQPVGDRAFTKRLLHEVPVNEQTQPAIVEIGLGNGVDPEYGFRLMLEEHGVCNAITTIDVKIGHGELDQKSLSAVCVVLLEYFYRDIVEKVQLDVTQREDQDKANTITETIESLGELLDRHSWIVTETGHHVDATHLSSVVRLSRNVSLPKHLEMARDLARYGSRLPEDFQYPGDTPFESTFADHLVWFQGLLDECEKDVQDAIDLLNSKSEKCHELELPMVVETLVDFLVKANRPAEALEVALERLAGKFEPVGVAPGLFEIATTDELRERLSRFFEEKGDLLGYAVCGLAIDR
jgi:hypothetical protein